MSETRNFNRLVRLLAGGGTMVLRKLLGKCTAPVEVPDYFYQNQGVVLKIKFTEKQRQLVVGRNIEKMDITLLCKLVLDLFKGSLTKQERNDTLAIKAERDFLLHSDILESAKLSTQMFEKRWQDLSSVLLELADEIGDSDFKVELQEFIDETKRSDPDFVKIYEILTEWCQSNAELQEKVEALARSVEELKVSQAIPMTRCDGLKDKFLCQYEYSNSTDIQLTEKMKEAKEYLSRSYSVVLYGRPGEGKTTAAFRIVKCLVDEEVVSLDRCAIVYEPDDFKDIKSMDVDLLLIDDVFGKHNAEKNKLELWRSLFATLKAFVVSRKVRIIFASRMHIYIEYKRELDGHVIFSKKVELTSGELAPEEKKQILKSQLKANGREMSEIEIEECIYQKETNAGFPLCAQQFASDESLFSKKAGYFTKPYKYCLEQNIQNLEEQSFIALLYVLYKDNKLKMQDIDMAKMSKSSQEQLVHIASLCGVEKSTAAIVKDTRQKLNHLKDSYLRYINKTFSFFHDTMYEAVAKLHAENFPCEIIEHCTIDYLCQCVRLQDEENEGIIVIEEDDFTTLAERCIYEVIQNENGKRLSEHPMLENETFVQVLISAVMENDETFKDFFSKGLSFNYVGIHAFLYHVIVSCKGNNRFFNEARPYLRCNHSCDDDKACWKCKVMSEALAAICSINHKGLYTELENDHVKVTVDCLYKAVENEDVDPDLVKMIISDLKQTGNYVADNQNLQFCLGMSMKLEDKKIFNILKESGLHFTTQSLYFAVKRGDGELVQSLLNELVNNRTWMPDDMYASRAVTEAHATGKNECLDILTDAGAKLTVASVYWAIIEHGFEEVVHVVKTLKENDSFDPESYEMAWSMAMAMKSDDKRIYTLLKEEGVLPTDALVMALAEIGHDADDIMRIIDELKAAERWNAGDLYITAAYMASRRRADKRLIDMLEAQGAGITTASLTNVVVWSKEETVDVVKTLKETGQFDPSNRYIAKAFVWSIEFKDKTIYNKLVSEGLCLTMSCLVYAVESTVEVLQSVIAGLKQENKWKPEDDAAFEAVNSAYSKQDQSAYNILLSEGVQWGTRNLYVAVELETVHRLKLVIRELKKRGLLKDPCQDISDAVSIARSLKDKRKLNVLKCEGLVS